MSYLDTRFLSSLLCSKPSSFNRQTPRMYLSLSLPRTCTCTDHVLGQTPIGCTLQHGGASLRLYHVCRISEP
jgi:hypothetical protein